MTYNVFRRQREKLLEEAATQEEVLKMFIIANRINSKKSFAWTADIITDSTFTHRISAWNADGQAHYRIKTVDGDILAEISFPEGTQPNNDDITKWIFSTLRANAKKENTMITAQLTENTSTRLTGPTVTVNGLPEFEPGEEQETSFDTITIYRDGEEIDEIEVESSEDSAPYDAAVREAGYANFTWA